MAQDKVFKLMEMEVYPRFAKAHNLLPKLLHYPTNNNSTANISFSHQPSSNIGGPSIYASSSSSLQPSLTKSRSQSAVEAFRSSVTL